MPPEGLHCTSHLHIEGPDDTYEKEWFRKLDKPEILLLKRFFWDEHRCAAEISLSQRMKGPGKLHPFVMEGSVPHVSLSTLCDHPWNDIGSLLYSVKKPVTSAQTVTYCQHTYNSKAKVYTTPQNWIVSTKRTVEMIHDNKY